MLYTLPIKTNLSRDKHGNGVTYGRVEKTDPRSADYPMDYSTDYPTDYPYGLP